MIIHKEQDISSIFRRRTTLLKCMAIVNIILYVSMLIGCLCFMSGNGYMVCYAIFSLICTSLSGAYLIRKPNDSDTDIGFVIQESIIPFIALLIGATPSSLYCLSQGNLDIISQYGLPGIWILLRNSNIELPISFLLLISIWYWFEIITAYKESSIYRICKNHKKTLWT
jgi:hypothetical protein